MSTLKIAWLISDWFISFPSKFRSTLLKNENTHFLYKKGKSWKMSLSNSEANLCFFSSESIDLTDKFRMALLVLRTNTMLWVTWG
jgi:hypothetical protein